MEERVTVKIWHQSYTDLTQLPGYSTMLADHARRICDPETVVDLHGVAPGTYPDGVAPIDIVGFAYANHLVFPQIVENAIRAEHDGYDAMAISCFIDPALELARSMVDIPVVSSCEAALLVSASIGRSPGLVTLDEVMAKELRRLVDHYGYGDRVVAVMAMDPPINEFQIDRAFVGSPEFVELFARQAHQIIGRGADVIIPAEGVLNTALVRNEVRSILETPVLDSYGSLLALAEMLVRLRRRSGLSTSRSGTYARPPDTLMDKLRSTANGVLQLAAKPPGSEPRRTQKMLGM
jgi:allantoin racemase